MIALGFFTACFCRSLSVVTYTKLSRALFRRFWAAEASMTCVCLLCTRPLHDGYVGSLYVVCMLVVVVSTLALFKACKLYFVRVFCQVDAQNIFVHNDTMMHAPQSS